MASTSAQQSDTTMTSPPQNVAVPADQSNPILDAINQNFATFFRKLQELDKKINRLEDNVQLLTKNINRLEDNVQILTKEIQSVDKKIEHGFAQVEVDIAKVRREIKAAEK